MPTQKSKFPRFPEGRNIILKVAPKKTINIYMGVRNPHTGHMARIEQMNTATPAIDIIGISAGKSTSSSILLLNMHGPINVMYKSTDTRNPMQVRATYKKKVLTLGFSHTCLKKLVL